MKFNHNIYIHACIHNLYLNTTVFFFCQLGGGGGGNLELKSSEMARNRKKTAKSEVYF